MRRIKGAGTLPRPAHRSTPPNLWNEHFFSSRAGDKCRGGGRLVGWVMQLQSHLACQTPHLWSWALYRAGISVVRVTCSARKLHQYAVWHALLIST